jgi:hypothetical protein
MSKPKPTRALLREITAKSIRHARQGERIDISLSEWQQHHSFAEFMNGESPFEIIRRCGTAAVRLSMLGKALESGGEIPQEAAKWLGHALVEIARGANPDAALGIWRGKGRPVNIRRRKSIAATMAYLVHHGMSQDAAAHELAELMGKEPRELKQAHNDLKARRGLFVHVESVEPGQGEIMIKLREGRHPLILGMDHADAMLSKTRPGEK